MRYILLLFALLLVLPYTSYCEEYVYFDQGGVRIFVQDNKAGLQKTNGDIVLPAEYDEIEPYIENIYTIVHKHDKCGVVDKTGYLCIDCVWDYIELYHSVGLAKCMDYNEPDLSYNIFDIESGHIFRLDNGREIIRHGELLMEQDGLAYFLSRPSNDEKHNITYVYDNQGNMLLTLKGYLRIPFIDGIAVIESDDNKTDIIDINGNSLIRFDYGTVHLIKDGIIYYTRNETNGQTIGYRKTIGGIADQRGVILEVPEMDIVGPASDDLYIVNAGRNDIVDYEWDERGLYGYIDKNGNVVIPTKYDYVTAFYQGYAAVCEEGRWHFINRAGDAVGQAHWEYETLVFSDYVFPFAQGWEIVPVGLDKKTRLVDRRGNWINQNIYSKDFARSETYNQTNEKRFVFLRNLEGALCYVSDKGLSPFVDQTVESFIMPREREKCWWVRIDGLWGALDLEDNSLRKWIIPPTFRELKDLGDYLWVSTSGMKYDGMYITLKGEPIGPAKNEYH